MKLFGRQIPLFGGNDDDRRRERPRAAASRPRTQRSAFDLRGRLVLVCGTLGLCSVALLARALGLQALPDRVLRLDPALPFGDERDLDLLPNTLPPQRHLGYAVQWFGLALTVLVVAGVLERRRRRVITR